MVRKLSMSFPQKCRESLPRGLGIWDSMLVGGVVNSMGTELAMTITKVLIYYYEKF